MQYALFLPSRIYSIHVGQLINCSRENYSSDASTKLADNRFGVSDNGNASTAIQPVRYFMRISLESDRCGYTFTTSMR